MGQTKTDPRRSFIHLVEAVRADGRYPMAAFEFLQRGLEYTTHLIHTTPRSQETGPRHVSGAELCRGLRDLALDLWGPLAQAVLGGWGIRGTRDFGEMVFLMVGLGVFGKQDSDRIEDFDDVYRFEDVFSGYSIPLNRFDGQDDDAPSADHEPEDESEN